MQSKKFWVGYLTGLATWSVLSYATLFEYMAKGELFARTIIGAPYISDFVNSYNAGVLARDCVMSNQATKVYDVQTQDVSARRLIAPVKPLAPFYFQYPPYMFGLMLPMAFVPMPVAWVLWNVLGMVALSFSILALSKDFSKWERIASFVMFIGSYPMWLSVELGQPSLWVIPCLTAYLICLQVGKPFNAGVATALAAVKLQYAPMLGVVGVIRGRWKYLLGGIACMAALLLYTLILLGPENVMQYPRALLSGETSGTVSGVNAHEMQNFRGMLALIFRDDARWIQITASGLMIATIGFVGWLWSRRPPADALCGVTVLLMLLSNVHAHTQDYVLSGVACIFLWRWYRTQSAEAQTSKRLVWIRRLIVYYPIYGWIALILKPVLMLISIVPFLIWGLALSVLVMLETKLFDLRRLPD